MLYVEKNQQASTDLNRVYTFIHTHKLGQSQTHTDIDTHTEIHIYRICIFLRGWGARDYQNRIPGLGLPGLSAAKQKQRRWGPSRGNPWTTKSRRTERRRTPGFSDHFITPMTTFISGEASIPPPIPSRLRGKIPNISLLLRPR